MAGIVAEVECRQIPMQMVFAHLMKRASQTALKEAAIAYHRVRMSFPYVWHTPSACD